MKGIMDSERTIGNDGLTRGVFSPKIKPKVSLLPICKLKQINSERNLVNPGRRLEPLEEQSGNVISRSKPREKLHLCRQKCTLKVPALFLNISRPVLPVPNTLAPVVISNTPAVKYTSSQWKKPVLSRSNKKAQIKSFRNNKKELETNNHLRFREKHHCVLSYHGSSPKLNETDYQLPNDTNFESLSKFVGIIKRIVTPRHNFRERTPFAPKINTLVSSQKSICNNISQICTLPQQIAKNQRQLLHIQEGERIFLRPKLFAHSIESTLHFAVPDFLSNTNK